MLAPIRGMFNQAIEDGDAHANPASQDGEDSTKEESLPDDKKIDALTRAEVQVSSQQGERDLAALLSRCSCAP